MAPTTRQHREGTLIYVKENRELYMRVDDGVRQVMLGEYNPFPRDLDNPVAAVETPLVVHYTYDYPTLSPPRAPPPPEAQYPVLPDPRYQPPHDTRYQGEIEPTDPRHSDPRYSPSAGTVYQGYPDPRRHPHNSHPHPDSRHHTTHHHRPVVQELPSHTHTSGPALHLIALNSPQTGDMLGIKGVDHQCFLQAQAIGLKGTFRAFLSSRLQDLYTIVRKDDRDRLPVVNLKDEALFSDWESIFSDSEGRISDDTHIYSFDGRDVLNDDAWPEKMVWHGSSTRGHRQTDSYCETWRTSSYAVTGMASSLQDGYLLQQSPRSCTSSFIILCIENAYIAK